MLIEKRRESEIARRKGRALKTVIQSIWLAISFAGAYFFVQILFEEGIVSQGAFYGLGVPTSVPRWVFEWFIIFLIVVAMQFVFILGYVIASPEGRQRAGQATAFSKNPDPLDREYR
jgi:hypothetical protein